ncbi:MAG TPA: molecular chaperone TorD family protein [Anaerolineae bacterium]
MMDFTLDQVARARQYTYALLGRLFLEELTTELLPLVQAIQELAGGLPELFDPDEIAADHQHLFGFNLFPYESIFLDTTGLLGGAVSEGVWGHYRRAGYDIDAMATSPDHIGHELAFLAFLSGAEADAWEDNVPLLAQQTQQQQREFLQTHLLHWLPPLVLATRQQSHPFYTALADLTVEFIHAHYAAIPPAVEIDFQLATPPTLLDDDATGLKEIAAYLATPPYSGVYLSRDDIGRLARRQRLPRGFGSRQQILANLMRAAVQYEVLPSLLADLQAVVGSWLAGYNDLAASFPKLSPIATVWQARAGGTARMVSQMSSQLHPAPEA